MRFQQGGLFAADVCARAEVGIDVQRVIRAEQLVAEHARLFHLGDLLVEEGSHMPELAAQVDVGRLCADRVAGQCHPLQELEGILLHDLAVLERARLGLVCVGDHIMRPVLVVHERPLHAGREPRAAAAAQSGSLDHVGHLFRLHFGDSVLERLETAVLLVDIQLVDVGDVTVPEEQVCHYFTSLPVFFNASISSTVLSTVMFS